MARAAKQNHSLDPSLLENSDPIRILSVEDDGLSMEFIRSQIDDLGHTMIPAENGEIALEILKTRTGDIDVVLMDRDMPVMDGLAAVRRMKEDPALREIPVVMITGADSLKEMKEGIDAGVFYYLTKPVEPGMLRSVLSAAVRDARQSKILARELARHRDGFHLLENGRFKFSTLEQAESLAAFMANCFPDPLRVLSGLGELLVNAIEHGNLGLGYDRKTGLIDAGTWRAEIERLQKLPEHAEKQAIATLARRDEGIYVIIEDEGTGFEWRKFMEIDLDRAGDNHGRGIALANAMSFDKLSYNETGNKAVAFVGEGKSLKW